MNQLLPINIFICFAIYTSICFVGIICDKDITLQTNASYDKLSARAKASYIKRQIQLTKNSSGEWPTPQEFGNFLTSQNANLSFDYVSDELHEDVKIRAVHSVGVVASAIFKVKSTAKHQFSGILGSGCKNTILRLSSASKPSETHISPGIGVKFLRDGLPSVNFVAMYSLEGQDGLNFFQNTLQNHVERPSTPSDVLNLLEKKFQGVTKITMKVALSHIASAYENGTFVNEKDIKFPYMLRLVPSSRLRRSYKEGDTIEKQYNRIKINSTLYRVYAKPEPDSTEEEEIHIGNLIPTSKFVSSEYGDKKILFSHHRMDDDYLLRPEWKAFEKEGTQ